VWYSTAVAFPRQVPNIPRVSEVHELREDVVYDHVGGVPLRFDHYRTRKADGPAPCVVVVHGGAWSRGDPSQAAGNALHFARRGISTVSISYRLAPEHRFPAQLDDVRRGLRWVRAHAGDLGIDPERIALIGLSAGAHLALLVHVAGPVEGLASALPPALAGVSESVRAVIGHYGPYDLTRTRPIGDWDPMQDLFGDRARDANLLHLASPRSHVANATAPVLLIHGTADQIVSHKESVRMHEALEAAGKTSELLLLEGAPHAFQMQWKGEANRRANEAMDVFLDRHL
jgi:acetyl esterase/lipase